MSLLTQSQFDAEAAPRSAPSLGIRLVFLGNGLTAEIDAEDADLAQQTWRLLKAHERLPYAYGRNGAVRNQAMHRVIAARMGCDIQGKHVDHINGDTLDNRRSNLRAVSPAVNVRNTDTINAKNTSGYRGVSQRKKDGRFRAYIRTNYKTRHIGLFATAEEANAARLAAEAAEWGVEVRRKGAHR